MRLTVTGADGFVGRHVVKLAAAAGHDVDMVVLRDLDPSDPLRDVVTRVQVVDLTSSQPDVSADGVIHLAGLAAVGPSFSAPQRYLNANSAMMTNVAEATLAKSPDARVIAISSGAVYGGETGLIDESRPVHMTSPYVVAKRLIELQAEYYTTRGLDVIVARPFNHIGPGQNAGFLVPDLALQLMATPPGAPIMTGTLSTERDYTDVRDVAASYLMLCQAPVLADRTFNVATGTARSGHDVLTALCAALGFPVPEVEVDSQRVRPNDAASIAGDASRLAAATGWKAERRFEESIADFVAALSDDD